MTENVKPHRGVLVLIFGILGLVFCLIFGILAWVWGKADLAEMDAGRMDSSGRGMTNAGRILGMIGVAVQVLYILLMVLGVAGGIAAS